MKSTQHSPVLARGSMRPTRLVPLLFFFAAIIVLWTGQPLAWAAPNQDSVSQPIAEKEMERIAQTGGAIEAMLARGDILYIGAGANILVVDATSPNRPVVVGVSESLTDTVRQLAFGNSHLFAAVGAAGLIALDVSSPARPQVVSRTWTGRAEAIALRGANAFVVDSSYGVRVFDVTNPAAPLPLGGTPTLRQGASAVAILGNRLLIGRGYSGMEIIDIANPTQPQLLERRQPGNAIEQFIVMGDVFYAGAGGSQWKIFRLVNGQTVVEAGDFEGNFRTGAVVGATLFAADWLRLIMYNVADPLAPVKIGVFDPSNSKNVDLIDRYQRMTASGNRLFAVNQFEQVRVFNVVNQATPVQLGLLERSPGALRSLVAEGDALWTLEDQKLRVHSLRSPTALVEENVFLLTTTSQATALVKNGPLIYIAGFNGVTIVDVANRRAPQLVGATSIGAAAYGLAFTDGFVVIPSYQQCNVFDVRVPAAPTQIGQFDCSNTGPVIAAHRSHVYFRDGTGDLSIVALTGPSAPALAGWLPMDRSLHDLAVADSYLLIAVGDELRVMDLSNPAAPMEVGSFGSGGLARIVGVQDQIVYAVDFAGRLQVISLADPVHPQRIGLLPLTPALLKLTVTGDYGFAVNDAAGLTTLWLGNRFSQEQETTTRSFAPTSGITYSFVSGAFLLPPEDATTLTFVHREPFPGEMSLPSSMTALTPASELQVYRTDTGQAMLPTGPVTVTVHLPNLTSQGVLSETTAIYGWTEAGWQPFPGAYDPVAETVTAPIDPFAPWRALAVASHRIWLPLVARPAPDVRIVSVETTQAIQTADNRITLAAGKPTLLRVFAATSDSQAQNNLTLTIAASRNGQPIAASPLIVGPWAVFPNPVRGEYTHSFNALLPAAWLTGDISLALTVTPAGPDANSANNVENVTLSFRYVPPLELRLVPIEYVDTSTGVTYPPLTTEAISDFVQRTYPVGQINLSMRSPVTFRGNLRQLSEVVRLLGIVETLKKSDGAPAAQVYYGLLPSGGYGAAAGGIGYLDRRVSLGFNDGGIAAHEIGHNFGRRHAPCGNPAGVDPNYPYPNASIGEWGFDSATYLLQSPEATRDIMSYCSPKWFSDYTYRALLEDQLRRASLGVATMGAGLLVRARLDDAGGATLLPLYALDDALLDADKGGDYAIVLLASDGRILAEHPTRAVEAEEEGIQARAIAALVPLPDAESDTEAVAAVQIRRGDEVLAERVVHSQVVADASILRVEQGIDELVLRWEGDGAPILARYSHDGGVTWTTVAVDQEGDKLTLDPQRLPGGNGFFQLIFADALGRGVSAAASELIVLPDKPPRAWITGPAETRDGEPTILFGRGDDLEDGVLDMLRWTVDGQPVEAGQVLQLSRLTAGDHLVTLEVIDSSGQRAIAEHRVRGVKY